MTDNINKIFEEFINSKLYKDYNELNNIYKEIYIMINSMKKKGHNNSEIIKSYNLYDIKRFFNFIEFCKNHFHDIHYMLLREVINEIISTVIRLYTRYETFNKVELNDDYIIDTIYLTDINYIDNWFMLMRVIYRLMNEGETNPKIYLHNAIYYSEMLRNK